MAKNKIIRLNPVPDGFGTVADKLEADMFASTMPTQHTHLVYEDDDEGLYVGVWDTTDMTEVAGAYPCNEFMFLLDGEASIKNNRTGMLETVIAGEGFVIPKGYDCQWQQTGYLRKFFIILQHPDEIIPAKSTYDHIVYFNEQVKNTTPITKTSDGHQKQALYQDLQGHFLAGIWTSNAFKTPLMSFPYHEFMVINEGCLICTDEDNVEHIFTVGDAVFMPKNTLCSWQAKDKVSVYYTQIRQHTT